jgi:leucine dehydrogenase
VTLTTSDAGLDLNQTEELVVVHDRTSGLGAAIAIDDTTLGPGVGGIRWRPYPDEEAAIIEVRRLARVMTLKCAVAGIPSGGAKSVIFRPKPTMEEPKRHDVIEAFGRVVKRLGGRYIPGLDMGTVLEDLRVISTQAPNICVIEPSEQTSVGVFAGIAAAAEVRWGTGLSGKTVLIQGAGHVGSGLARRLAEAGAIVGVADVDEELARSVARASGGFVVRPAEVIGHPCDVFAPCAIGRLVDHETVGAFACEVIAGAANDVLTHRGGAELLQERGIDYVPDFLINSGGVIAIYAAGAGWDATKTSEWVGAIGTRVDDVMREARSTGRTPLAIAEEIASKRVGHPVSVPD